MGLLIAIKHYYYFAFRESWVHIKSTYKKDSFQFVLHKHSKYADKIACASDATSKDAGIVPMVNIWDLVGSVGFLLCAIYGKLGNVDEESLCCRCWGTAISTFRGSIMYLVGNFFMCMETANKHLLGVTDAED